VFARGALAPYGATLVREGLRSGGRHCAAASASDARAQWPDEQHWRGAVADSERSGNFAGCTHGLVSCCLFSWYMIAEALVEKSACVERFVLGQHPMFCLETTKRNSQSCSSPISSILFCWGMQGWEPKYQSEISLAAS
jgi:hypothetical protein